MSSIFNISVYESLHIEFCVDEKIAIAGMPISISWRVENAETVDIYKSKEKYIENAVLSGESSLTIDSPTEFMLTAKNKIEEKK